MSSIQLSELAIYPVKSMAQIVLKESRVDHFGLEYDRRWMVVDKQGRFITQRRYPRLCLIKVTLLHNSSIQGKPLKVNSSLNAIQMSAPQMPPLTIVLPTKSESFTVTIWHDQCHAIDCGSEVADWLSDFLSIKCQLVYFAESEIRQVDRAFANPGDRTAFSDGFPLLLISKASLDSLNNKLDKTVPMHRFRPNLVVTGCDAFEEDNWKLLAIGDMRLRVVKPCSRCVIPSIDTRTGEKGSEPTKTLLTFRKRDNKIYFGQNVIANSPGYLAVGNSVEVLE